MREVGPGRRHLRDLRRHVVDPGQYAEPPRRLRRLRRQGAPVPRAPRRKRRAARAARGLPRQRAGRDRLPRVEERGRVRPRGAPSRLPRAAGRGRGRPRPGGEGVRRPRARRRLRARASADRGIHAARRHDGRQARPPGASRALPLAGQFRAQREARAALRGRSPQVSARHAPDDGQCAGRAAVLQPAAKRRPDPVRCPDRGASAGGGQDRRRRCPPRYRNHHRACPQRRGAGDRRLRAEPGAARRADARSRRGAGALHGARGKHRRRAFARARRGRGARLRPQRRALDAGLDYAARRRQPGPVPALPARPREAGPDRGQRRRAALRERRLLVPRLRRGDVRGAQASSGHPGLADLHRGVRARVRPGRHLPGNPQPGALRARGHAGARRLARGARAQDRGGRGGAGGDAEALQPARRAGRGSGFPQGSHRAQPLQRRPVGAASLPRADRAAAVRRPGGLAGGHLGEHRALPTRTRACSTARARRLPGSTPAATTWLRSSWAPTPALGPRSARRSPSAIAPRCMLHDKLRA